MDVLYCGVIFLCLVNVFVLVCCVVGLVVFFGCACIIRKDCSWVSVWVLRLVWISGVLGVGCGLSLWAVVLVFG